MAKTQNSEEPTFHKKRKLDLNGEDSEEYSKKAQKVDSFNNNSLASADKSEECEAIPKSKNNLEVPNCNCSSTTDQKVEEIEYEVVVKEAGNEDDGDEDEVDNDDEDDNEDGDEDEDEDADVDRKGKGIMRDDKGKGKLIEEESEDEDGSGSDDSSDDVVVSDGDSDLSDDPLAEVDLDNILPSRTRRRTIHPGVYIPNDMLNDEDDDSDA